MLLAGQVPQGFTIFLKNKTPRSLSSRRAESPVQALDRRGKTRLSHEMFQQQLQRLGATTVLNQLGEPGAGEWRSGWSEVGGGEWGKEGGFLFFLDFFLLMREW